jgi:hypothetical protein
MLNRNSKMQEIYHEARHRWLMLIFLATWKVEIGRIIVGGLSKQKVRPYLNKQAG